MTAVLCLQYSDVFILFRYAICGLLSIAPLLHLPSNHKTTKYKFGQLFRNEPLNYSQCNPVKILACLLKNYE